MITYKKNLLANCKALIYISIVATFMMLIPQNLLAQEDPAPVLRLDSSGELVIDADNSGSITVGDTLGYSATISNESLTAANEVRFLGKLDSNLTLQNETIVTSQGAVMEGDFVQIEVGELLGGDSVTITFEAMIGEDIEGGQVLTSVQISFAEDSESPGETGGLADNQNLISIIIDSPTSVPTIDEPVTQVSLFLPIVMR